MLLIGLSHENVKRMLAGNLVHVTKEHPAGDALPPGYELCIMSGETETSMIRQLKDLGLEIPADRINRDPRL